MHAMLNIAGGIVMGGGILGLFGGGWKLTGGSDIAATITGLLMMLAAAAIATWLIWGRLVAT